MDPSQLEPLLRQGLQHHHAGQLPQAAAVYQQILTQDANQPDALYLLGVVAGQTGQFERAVAFIQQALAIRPDFFDALATLGHFLHETGRLDEAISCLQRALSINPNRADVYNNLGTALRKTGQTSAAIACFQKALTLAPERPELHNNLALALRGIGQLDEAIASFRRALAIRPDNPIALTNLGTALVDRSLIDEAIACHRRALALQPDLVEAHNNLGLALQAAGQPDEAAASLRRALDLQPTYADASLNLGNVLMDQGAITEALDTYREAVALRPSDASAHSNLLYAMHFDPASDARTIRQEHDRWNQLHAAPLISSIPHHTNDRSPDRRLKIGYVSPDFRLHPVGRFLRPLLAAHDHQQFEIFIYSSVLRPDILTSQLRPYADHWRDVAGLTDEQLASQIHDDRIDILIDLTMHMAGSRMLLFARKPAPVQVTYLAYCSTTGLTTIDYRLTDPFLDPPPPPPLSPETDVQIYSEESVRLPHSYWCYDPGIPTPEVSDLPAPRQGFITFGCLNSFFKVSPAALETWAALLRNVPDSRLLLYAGAGSLQSRVQNYFSAHGIAPQRISFTPFQSLPEYFRLYHQIDIALDPFPYGGGTTSCDALWMGVPVITLAGSTAVGRGGLSILSNIGLPELIARTPDQYVQIASRLAQDLPTLSNLRSTLRQRMQNSPLMDAPLFARAVESTYRTMWRRWCANPG